MKNIKLLALLLPIGLLLFLLQGCYTQLATIHEESTYEQEEQPYSQTDSTYDNEEEDWHSHPYIGFDYYYPSWRSYWWWDYCYYPTYPYWDPWWWGPVIYPYYAYYPYHFNHWYSYPHYSYYSTHDGYGYTYNSRPYVTRNSGYQRGGNSKRDYGVVRTNPSGGVRTIETNGGRAATSRRDITLPTEASVGSQRSNSTSPRSNSSGSSTSVRNSRGISKGRSTNSDFKPDVQQPRHRDQSSLSGSTRGRSGSSRQSGQSRSSSRSTDGYSRPSAPSPSPSHTPSAPRTSSPPSSSGGGRQSGGGRSHR